MWGISTYLESLYCYSRQPLNLQPNFFTRFFFLSYIHDCVYLNTRVVSPYFTHTWPPPRGFSLCTIVYRYIGVYPDSHRHMPLQVIISLFFFILFLIARLLRGIIVISPYTRSCLNYTREVLVSQLTAHRSIMPNYCQDIRELDLEFRIHAHDVCPIPYGHVTNLENRSRTLNSIPGLPLFI